MTLPATDAGNACACAPPAFCIEAKRTFQDLGVDYAAVDLDKTAEGLGKVWEALKAMHAPQKTVPYVYVNKVRAVACREALRGTALT